MKPKYTFKEKHANAKVLLLTSIISLIFLFIGFYCSFVYNIGIYFCIISYFISYCIFLRTGNYKDEQIELNKKKAIVSITYFTFGISILTAFFSGWVNLIFYHIGRTGKCFVAECVPAFLLGENV